MSSASSASPAPSPPASTQPSSSPLRFFSLPANCSIAAARSRQGTFLVTRNCLSLGRKGLACLGSPACHAHVGHCWTRKSPATTNSSGVTTPFSANALVVRVVITDSAAPLNTVCTECFTLSTMDMVDAFRRRAREARRVRGARRVPDEAVSRTWRRAATGGDGYPGASRLAGTCADAVLETPGSPNRRCRPRLAVRIARPLEGREDGRVRWTRRNSFSAGPTARTAEGPMRTRHAWAAGLAGRNSNSIRPVPRDGSQTPVLESQPTIPRKKSGADCRNIKRATPLIRCLRHISRPSARHNSWRRTRVSPVARAPLVSHRHVPFLPEDGSAKLSRRQSRFLTDVRARPPPRVTMSAPSRSAPAPPRSAAPWPRKVRRGVSFRAEISPGSSGRSRLDPRPRVRRHPPDSRPAAPRSEAKHRLFRVCEPREPSRSDRGTGDARTADDRVAVPDSPSTHRATRSTGTRGTPRTHR